MRKRLFSILICTLLTVSLLSVNAFAGTPEIAAKTQAGATAKVKKITPAVTLSQTSFTWDGSAKKPKVTVKNESATLKKGTDYTVTYKNNVNVGKAYVKVTLKGKYSGSKTVSFKIMPKGTQISSLTKGKNCITVKVQEQGKKMSQSRITGYHIQLAANKEFTKGKKAVKLVGYQKTSKKFTGLKAGTKYYVRVRSYVKIGEKCYYSAWSDVKTQKTKAAATPTPTPTPAPFEPQYGESAFVYNANDVKLTDQLYALQQGNTIVSPMSIHLALAMLLEGAEGQTKTEIENFLGVTKENLDSYVQNILLSAADTDELKMIISNAFWYNIGQDVNGEYIQTLAERYGAVVSDLDFSDPDTAAFIINSWCSEKTNGLIPSIVQPGDLADMSDVILNTLYFKNSWAEPVDKYAIREGTFNGLGQNYSVTYLNSSERYAYENDHAVAFEKPYSKKYSFIGILPKAEGDFTLESLDLPGLMSHKIVNYDEVYAMMPKFTVESGGEITGILIDLGIRAAFTQAADLTGIAPELMVSKVIHKTKMILDENGTEAAAATAVVAEATAFMDMHTTTIKLDRPYAFMIVDRETGNILFLGKITNF